MPPRSVTAPNIRVRGRTISEKMEENDIKVTYVSLVMKCLIPALKKFPILNSQLDMSNEEIIYKNYYNIGISVDTNDGLVVPVIKDVDKKSIWEIAREIKNLAEKARAGKLDFNLWFSRTFGSFDIVAFP